MKPGWAYTQPFQVLSFPGKTSRKTLLCLAKTVGEKAEAVRRSREVLEEMLEADGVLRVTFETPYQKKCFKNKLRIAHPYAEVGLEENHDTDRSLWCELTFWAVHFWHLLSV